MSKYIITHNYGMMPNQIEGHTDDGRHFYFRGRHGRWQLHFSATPEDVTIGPGYEGENESAGWFEKEEWEAFFWQVVDLIEQDKATPLDQERHKKDMNDLLDRLMTPATPEQIQAFIQSLEKLPREADDE